MVVCPRLPLAFPPIRIVNCWSLNPITWPRITLPSFRRIVSASSGVEIETSSRMESRSRNVFFIILLPWGIPLTRFSKSRMLLQAGEGATVVRASDAHGAEKGCEIALGDLCEKHCPRAKAQSLTTKTLRHEDTKIRMNLCVLVPSWLRQPLDYPLQS